MSIELPSRALITGAGGFIGSALARRLADVGCNVHLLVRGSTQRPLPRGLDDDASVVVHELPATTDALVELVADIAPDACFHVASLFLAAHEPTQVEPLVHSNVLFPTQLAEACARAATGLRFVDVGTSWQHATGGDEYLPVNLYAATKQAFQDVLAWYAAVGQLRPVTVKLFDTYGPGDERGKLLSALARSVDSPEPMRMSPGEQRLDLLHVDDVVAALLRAFELTGAEPWPGYRAYGTPSGERLTLRELLEVFDKATGRTPRVQLGSLPYREREVMEPWEATTTALPGWSPRIKLQDGLRTTFSSRLTALR